MTEITGKCPSRHGQLTKIRSSVGCGGKTIPPVMQFGYDRHESEVIWGISARECRLRMMHFNRMIKAVTALAVGA